LSIRPDEQYVPVNYGTKIPILQQFQQLYGGNNYKCGHILIKKKYDSAPDSWESALFVIIDIFNARETYIIPRCMLKPRVYQNFIGLGSIGLSPEDIDNNISNQIRLYGFNDCWNKMLKFKLFDDKLIMGIYDCVNAVDYAVTTDITVITQIFYKISDMIEKHYNMDNIPVLLWKNIWTDSKFKNKVLEEAIKAHKDSVHDCLIDFHTNAITTNLDNINESSFKYYSYEERKPVAPKKPIKKPYVRSPKVKVDTDSHRTLSPDHKKKFVKIP